MTFMFLHLCVSVPPLISLLLSDLSGCLYFPRGLPVVTHGVNNEPLPPSHIADTLPSSAIQNPTSSPAYFSFSCPLSDPFCSPFIPWHPDSYPLYHLVVLLLSTSASLWRTSFSPFISSLFPLSLRFQTLFC